MSVVRAEAHEVGCRISGGQVGGEFIALSNQKRFPTPSVSAQPLWPGRRLARLLHLSRQQIVDE